MTSNLYDVIVVGGGPVGLATAYEVAKAGKSVMVLEQNNFFNQAGSSGDFVRMYRTMYTEKFMAELAKTSLAIWDELESDAGVSLRSMTGLLNFGDPTVGEKTPEGTLLGPIENLKALNMPYQELNVQQIEKRWPFKNLNKGWQGVFAPDNGVINVPLLLRSLSRLAKDYGAHTRQQIRVKKVERPKNQQDDWWNVITEKNGGSSDTYRGQKIVITSGAYTNQVLSESFDLTLDLEIWEMVANYFNVNAGPNGTVFPCMWFQFAPNKVLDDDKKTERSRLFYGFPTVEWGPQNAARIAVDAATNIIKDPSQRKSSVISPEDIADTQEFVRDHVVGVDSTVPAFSLTCLQTNVYDNMFVLDFIPQEYLKGGPEKSIILFTAGWAMKFVPLLGRALKEMALTGESEFERSEFSITRKGKVKDKDRSIIDHPKANGMKAMNNVGMRGQAIGSSVHYRNVEA